MNELLYYATLEQDHERVISFHLQRQEHAQAATYLFSQSYQLLHESHPTSSISQTHQSQTHEYHTRQLERLFYKYGSEMMLNCPEEIIDACICATFLDPKKLIPAFAKYKQTGNVHHPGKP